MYCPQNPLMLSELKHNAAASNIISRQDRQSPGMGKFQKGVCVVGGISVALTTLAKLRRVDRGTDFLLAS